MNPDVTDEEHALRSWWLFFHRHSPIYSQTVMGPWCDWCNREWPCPAQLEGIHGAREEVYGPPGPTPAEIQTAVDSIRRTA